MFDRSQTQVSEQERLDKAQAIVALVQDDAAMQTRLEILLKQYKLYKRRRQQGTGDLLEEIPEGMTPLMVPLLGKLDLYGHWVTPEPLLRIMFGHEFRNVCTLRFWLSRPGNTEDAALGDYRRSRATRAKSCERGVQLKVV